MYREQTDITSPGLVLPQVTTESVIFWVGALYTFVLQPRRLQLSGVTMMITKMEKIT